MCSCLFILNLNPVLLDLGFLQIRYYSLAYIIGFLLAYYVLYKAAKSKKVENLTEESVEDFMIYLILGVIIGGRLGYFIFYDPSTFWTQPLEVLKIWLGGMSFHGGLIGGIIGYYFFRKKHNIKFYDLADIISLPLAFALVLGRIANFINGELWGTISNAPWCVKFQDVEGCRHPSQLYEALKNFIIFGVLFFMNKKVFPRGTLFWAFVTLYGLGRFIVDFYRVPTTLIAGIPIGQILNFAMIFVGGYFLYKINKTKTFIK